MCHALPAPVVEVLPGDQAVVSLDGTRQCIDTQLVGPVSVGDYLVVHVGFALGKLDPDEAEATLAALRHLGSPSPQVLETTA